MNNTVEQIAPRLPAPVRVGQATAVEQSRAAAEVQAAVVVAQQCPRDVQAARLAVRDSCSQLFLAEKAFFRYKRGKSNVSGETIHLARELARCWGNVQYGIAELSRDAEREQSEMVAFAWDVQTNSRCSTTFIVPHKRDTTDGAKSLTDMRDIYENNANMGARRVREMIFAILPPWLVEEAKQICAQTIAKGGGDKPLAEQISSVIQWFGGVGIKPEQLETKIGRSRSDWTEFDVAQFRVISRAVSRGEVTLEEEFPPPRVTAAEVTGKAAPEQPVETEQKSADGAAENGEPAGGAS